MPMIGLPPIDIGVLKRGALFLFPLVLLHFLAWWMRFNIADGENIVKILAALTLLNLLLIGLLYPRFSRFAIIPIFSTYFFHALFFLLYFIEQRKI